MTARNGPGGYGWVTRTLHWLTVVVIATQFTVGYLMDPDDGCDAPGEERSGGDTRDRADERMDRLEERCEASAGGLDLLPGAFDLLDLHVVLGLTILTLAVTRVLWRRVSGLPPWSEHLSEGQRRLVHWTERVLLTLLFVVPLSGLALFVTGDDDVLTLHIAAHIAFFVALAAHLSTNLRPAILRRAGAR